jgi:hypothetical protein
MTDPPREAEPRPPVLSSAHPPYGTVSPPGPKPLGLVSGEETGRARDAAAGTAEETDVWWGSYSGWTLTPSCLACVLLTAVIAWAAWAFVPRGFVKGTIIALAGAVWLVQGVRWAYRVFGYNYRLTTRRVFCDRGFLYAGFAALDLAAVGRVLVRRSWSDRLVDVGQVLVLPEQPTQPTLVLEGVREPLVVAEEIRKQVQAARAGPPAGKG